MLRNLALNINGYYDNWKFASRLFWAIVVEFFLGDWRAAQKSSTGHRLPSPGLDGMKIVKIKCEFYFNYYRQEELKRQAEEEEKRRLQEIENEKTQDGRAGKECSRKLF